MTWDHPRGVAPLLACAELWLARTGVEIVWDRRSLQDFESYPVQELARRYDLLVIDHPHVGLVAEEGSLLAFDDGPEAVGPSLESYRWAGRIWALPIDAAAQVQAWRPDVIAAPAMIWDDVMAHARAGRVLLPLRPPHALMCVMTLAANAGHPCGSGGVFLDPEAGRILLARLRDLARHLDPACFAMDPIAVLERMTTDRDIACAPLIYGYIPYARAGFRAVPIAFADIPLPGAVGSALGGTGLAVSALSNHVEQARTAATWIASAEAQSDAYTRNGGQPAHLAAWNDPDLDAACGRFFSATRRTLEGAYVRPRGPGYMAFQGWASERVLQALRDGDAAGAIADLNLGFLAATRGP